MKSTQLSWGVAAALMSALLFGASTPFAKWLLGSMNPWLLAALLYLGSGLGLTLVRWIFGKPWPRISAVQWRWFMGAVALGGVIAPVLLMLGLARMPATKVSLLLNAEGVLTALLAWFVFKENVDRRIAVGMACIVAGALVLSWPTAAVQSAGELVPTLYVLAACLAWALDNNLTRKVAAIDATWIASVKGLVAGAVNLAIALGMDLQMPATGPLSAALALGFLAYGVSLTLFVLGLRHLGAARAGAYFALAPFAGALLSIPMLNESVTWQLPAAGLLMAIGVWLHVTESHDHLHSHGDLTHAHPHYPDVHHRHRH